MRTTALYGHCTEYLAELGHCLGLKSWHSKMLGQNQDIKNTPETGNALGNNFGQAGTTFRGS